LQDYLLAKDDAEVQQLLQATSAGQSLNLYHDTKVHSDLQAFPGCKRLDPSRNWETFDNHWDHVFEAIVSALTWEVESKTNMGNLENDLAAFHITENSLVAHPFSQLNGSVAALSAHILTEHRRLAYLCHHAKMAERTPSERTCINNLLSDLYP